MKQRPTSEQTRVIIVGVGGHGLVVADAVLALGGYDLVGFVAKATRADDVLGVAPLIGSYDDLAMLVELHQAEAVVVGIGDNHTRSTVITQLREELPKRVSFPAVVHPSVSMGVESSVGAASVVLAGAVLGPGACVGEGCVVNTRASLDHHGVMENYSSVAPGVTCGGNVRIGKGSAVSIGATVLHGITVGAQSVVGAGSVVLQDIPDGVVAYGIPARVVRTREPGDRYL